MLRRRDTLWIERVREKERERERERREREREKESKKYKHLPNRSNDNNASKAMTSFCHTPQEIDFTLGFSL